MTPSVQQLLQIVHKTDASKALVAQNRLPNTLPNPTPLAPAVGGVR
jgi:hypothetical protein